nr:trehalose-phosphatase [uncultured Dyadobacter sp.]
MSTNQIQSILEGVSLEIIREAFAKSNNRILFLDYDGTLTPIVDTPASAALPQQIKNQILKLCEMATVVIISGRDQQFLQTTFDKMPVNLIAEHGAFVKMPHLNDWQTLSPYGQSWQQALRPVLYSYQDRCPGSLVEQKASSLAWHYRTAKDEYAADKLATRLLEQLNQSTIVSGTDLEIIAGKKVIEIKKATYNKGTAAKRYLEAARYEFVLAMGDDTTDEHLFAALPEGSFSIKIGQGATFAQGRLDKQEDIGRFFVLLTQ